MKTILTALYSFLTTWNPVISALFVPLLSLYAVFSYMHDVWANLLGRIDAMAVAAGGGTVTIAPMGLLDTFVPLTETLTMFTAWVALYATCAAIRIIKSFIPTMAS